MRRPSCGGHGKDTSHTSHTFTSGKAANEIMPVVSRSVHPEKTGLLGKPECPEAPQHDCSVARSLWEQQKGQPKPVAPHTRDPAAAELGVPCKTGTLIRLLWSQAHLYNNKAPFGEVLPNAKSLDSADSLNSLMSRKESLDEENVEDNIEPGLTHPHAYMNLMKHLHLPLCLPRGIVISKRTTRQSVAGLVR